METSKEYWYEWKVRKIAHLVWVWEVTKVYESGVVFRDGHGDASTKWGAKRGARKHFEARTNPPRIKPFPSESGKF